jgi:AcrR family transcriptional regulator
LRETRDESQDKEDPEARNRRILGVAALEASGESGFRNLTVAKIAERASLDAESFYSQFPDPSSCFASGYIATVDELAADLLDATKRQATWVLGMRTGLYALGKLIEAEPFLAQGILLEVHVAGGAAQAKRYEVFERLSRAVDTARRENASRHSPPPIAATFILNMIEAVASKWLQEDEPPPFTEAIPDLLYLAASFYFGHEEAERQVRLVSGQD